MEEVVVGKLFQKALSQFPRRGIYSVENGCIEIFTCFLLLSFLSTGLRDAFVAFVINLIRTFEQYTRAPMNLCLVF